MTRKKEGWALELALDESELDEMQTPVGDGRDRGRSTGLPRAGFASPTLEKAPFLARLAFQIHFANPRSALH
jgi:hypothetical protein